MVKILSMLLPHKNFIKLQAKKVVNIEAGALEEVEKLINEEGYLDTFDYDNDGYITENDYHYLYNIFYQNWDSFCENQPYYTNSNGEPNILLLVRLKKLIASGDFDTDFNITGNGNMIIDKMDITVCERWLLYGKNDEPEFT